VRKAIALVAGLAVLAAANYTVHQRERHLADGTVVLLELAPVDPRSLMQGDYMALRFAVADESFGRGPVEQARDGHIVVALDPRGVGSFVRHDDAAPTAPGEVRLRYRIRNRQLKLATNAFFFQEGHAEHYEPARYGEFRVAPSGELLLTHLRGERLERLGPPEG